MKSLFSVLSLTLVTALLISCGASSSPYPAEVGPASFLRDFDKAQQLSMQTGKPIFAFFQEVPG